MPRIVLGDSEGLITADREIGVFDSTIRPGSEGTFEYEIINPHGKAMSYTMDVDQYYNNERFIGPLLPFVGGALIGYIVGRPNFNTGTYYQPYYPVYYQYPNYQYYQVPPTYNVNQ